MKLGVLEIECSNGSFLAKLRSCLDNAFPRKHFVHEGIDVDSKAIKNSMDLSLNLFCTSAEEFTEMAHQPNDLILHFELLEHLVDPHQFMVSLLLLLKNQGFLLVTTPNSLGLEMIASPYNENRLLALAIFLPMHLNAFNTIP